MNLHRHTILARAFSWTLDELGPLPEFLPALMKYQPMPKQYFSDFTWGKFFLYFGAAAYVVGVGIVSLFEPFMELPCDDPQNIKFPNPAFPSRVCLDMRYLVLLGFSRAECACARRLVASVLLGGLIGWERRQADRPAGIRTMSLVSLGSCLFTINSSFAFLNGPMTWDASRVAAAIPSGVGFLGAGLIFKKEEKGEDGDSNHVVHGLTTAASLWLSAAVGIACGGDLYMPASFCVAVMLLLLRFGPRQHEEMDDCDHEDTEEAYGVFAQDPLQTELVAKSTRHGASGVGSSEALPGIVDSVFDDGLPNYASIHQNEETMSLRSASQEMGRTMSFRQGTAQKRRKGQAALGSIV